MLINPTSERHLDRLRRLGAIVLAFAGALMGLATLSVALADEPNKDIILLIDNSRSVTEGDERRDIDPADATGRRVQLASFLVHYLDYVGAQGTRVGAITFADDAQLRVPLQKVSDWRAGDFKAIVGEKEGDTTNFVSALSAASAMLSGDAENTGQSMTSRSGEILIFTDGNLDEFDPAFYTESRYLAEIRRVLAELPEGTRVRLIGLDQDGVLDFQAAFTGTELIPLPPAEHNMDESYIALLNGLFGNHELGDYVSVSVANKREVDESIAPYRDWVRYSILSDRPVTVTFEANEQPVQPLSEGSGFLFMRPPAGEWTLGFESEEPATVFYKKESAPLPITIEPEVHEWYPADEPVRMAATLRAGSGQVITPTHTFPVTATVTGPDDTIDVISMVPDPSTGRYLAEKSFADPLGRAFVTYTVAFDAVGRAGYSDLSAEVDSPTFTVIQPAGLSGLEVKLPENPGEAPLNVTIGVAHEENLLRPALAVTLIDQASGAIIIDQIVSNLEDGAFRFALPSLGDGEYRLEASIDPAHVRGPFGGARIEGLLQLATPIVNVNFLRGAGHRIEVPEKSGLGIEGADMNLLAGGSGMLALVLVSLGYISLRTWNAREVVKASRALSRSGSATPPEVKYSQSVLLFRKVSAMIHNVFAEKDVAGQLLKEEHFLRQLDEPRILQKKGPEEFDAFAMILADVVATCFSREDSHNKGFHALQVILNYSEAGYHDIRKRLLEKIAIEIRQQPDIVPLVEYVRKLDDPKLARGFDCYKDEELRKLESIQNGYGDIGAQWFVILYNLQQASLNTSRTNLRGAEPQLVNIKSALQIILEELPDTHGEYFFRSLEKAIDILICAAERYSDDTVAGDSLSDTERKEFRRCIPNTSIMYEPLNRAFPEILPSSPAP